MAGLGGNVHKFSSTLKRVRTTTLEDWRNLDFESQMEKLQFSQV